MELEKRHKIYWDSLTPKQKFEWEYFDIDPKTKRPDNEKVCYKHFEPYVQQCPKCSEHFDQSIYDHRINNNIFY